MTFTFQKKHLLIFAFLVALKGFAQTAAVKQSDLMGCWFDSYEENAENAATGIYRHCNYKEFPASRFRFRMELHPKGVCRYLYIAPNDAHKIVKGTWTFNAATNTIVLKNDKGATVNTFKVVKAKKDLLEVEKKK